MASRIITVAQVGVANHRTVQEAVDAVPLHNRIRTVIRVAPGEYRHPVYVNKNKNTLAGLGPGKTVLKFNNTASKIVHPQPSRLVGTKTFGCGTVIIEGEDFIAENITFENFAPPPQGNEQQAVAVRVTADRCAFYNCRFLSWQDTLYLHSGSQYLRECYIEGSVDFICGNSTALLENCHIHCKSYGFITAQKRMNSKESTGYVFLSCKITGTGGKSYTYLGRPWGPFARVAFAYSIMDPCVRPDGWDNWPEKAEYQRTACFHEYKCTGPGSSPSKPRVKWVQPLTDNEADKFLADGSPWLATRTAVKLV